MEQELSFGSESRSIIRIALPLALANLVDRSSVWVTWVIVGQAGGAAVLGPASLASTVNNVLGTSVNIGLSLAVSTLSAQASGAGDKRALNLSLQRALPVSAAFSLPVVMLLLTLGPLLRLLGRPPEFADTAAEYAMSILPVAALTGAQRSMMAWLAAFQISRPLLYINLILWPMHAALTYILVFHSSLGYLGAGVATSVHALARAGATYGFICTSHQTSAVWKGFEPLAALSGWGGYLALALPGVLMLSEFWVS